MKLVRLKITDPKGFRSLQTGFEHHFRTPWEREEERGFAPFVCAGPNGSGKSNLLEALGAILYHMECMYLENLPDAFRYEEQKNPMGFRSEQGNPDGFEIDYLIDLRDPLMIARFGEQAFIRIVKRPEETPTWFVSNYQDHDDRVAQAIDQSTARQLLPDYVLGYSSGENEILSLPFFKMRFVQYDEYWQALKQQLPYAGQPESRLVYLDSGFSQAILLCNLLLQDADVLKPFREDVRVEALTEFRIIIRRSIEIDENELPAFGSQDESRRESIEEIIKNHPALSIIETEVGTKRYRVNLVKLIEADRQRSSVNFGPIVTRLQRCATCAFVDEATDTLYLDYYVNEATKQAFRENFDFEVNRSPIALFQALQVLLTLNLYSVSDALKADLYKSDSLYVGETVPTLASDERIMRFKNCWLKKTDVNEPVLLKSLSDGEHQLLHSVGLCLLFRNTNSLFLLDEPETHFNPDWRSNYITRLHECFLDSDGTHEMLITTHTPFLISDSMPEKVLVFDKDKTTGLVSVDNPHYNTLGASINKITMKTFDKHETIGGHAQIILENLRSRFQKGEDKGKLIDQIDKQLGDSVEKMLLIKTILDSMETQD